MRKIYTEEESKLIDEIYPYLTDIFVPTSICKCGYRPSNYIKKEIPADLLAKLKKKSYEDWLDNVFAGYLDFGFTQEDVDRYVDSILI